jgi:uncharacterized protein YxeA
MKKNIVIIVLTILIIVSNALWLYRSLDFGVSYTYLSDSYNDNKNALNQVLTILPLIAEQKCSKDEIIQKAKSYDKSIEPFEKDGYTWIGFIGIKFDEKGKVTEVKKGWEE